MAGSPGSLSDQATIRLIVAQADQYKILAGTEERPIP